MGANDQGLGARGFEQSLEDSVYSGESSCRPDSRSGAVLKATIEGEIIPRLMLAHRVARDEQRVAKGLAAPALDKAGLRHYVEKLVQLVLADESAPVAELVRELRGRGLTVERLLLEVLAPTARRLGELWTADLCTFTEVTLGLGRLQYLLRDLSLTDHGGTMASLAPRRALVVAVPGEQHSFGSWMVAEFLRREGWDVSSEPCSTVRDLVLAVRSAHYDVVGLSLSVDRSLATLREAVEAVREASANRGVPILVGGRVFADSPWLVDELGADGMARDATEASVEAANLVARSRRAGRS